MDQNFQGRKRVAAVFLRAKRHRGTICEPNRPGALRNVSTLRRGHPIGVREENRDQRIISPLNKEVGAWDSAYIISNF
jgi:hypothetical protein